MNRKHVPVAEMKSRLSEYVSESQYNHERFIITKRNKPVAVLVNIEDLRTIEQSEERKGLVSVIGKWNGFEEIEESLRDIKIIREKGGEVRDVSV